ncbi:hypothetical protein [Rhodococcus erythropolis]|nr:hypothetical protein [Rhodococcus erythropolis]
MINSIDYIAIAAPSESTIFIVSTATVMTHLMSLPPRWSRLKLS